MQIRNYFGKSLGNKFEIDKYVSYVRFKQYLNNDFNTARSRTHEWRMRVAPAYNINSNLKLGLTLTYNNYLLKNNSNQEDINLAGSVRYAFDNMAVLFL
ncbi:MAG: hypothetical protein KDD50_15135, partial [Bdellovibrionales bacterium]|nr:hypothetical protein [Bdellovibrionales bacterium]